MLDFLEEAQLLPNKHRSESTTAAPGVESRGMMELRLGTSAFVASGWQGSFYPVGMKSADYLTYYATKFDTVEVDSTFYRAPSVATVSGWERKTPPGFKLAAEVPQIITHEKVLQNCDDDLKQFLDTMDLMGEKLGPLLFQFGHFNSTVFRSGKEFLARLAPFLSKLPKDHHFALEIRNKWWLDADFFDLLRVHNVAYALTERSFMPSPTEIFAKLDPITADFAYIRWLGDRMGSSASQGFGIESWWTGQRKWLHGWTCARRSRGAA